MYIGFPNITAFFLSSLNLLFKDILYRLFRDFYL